MEGLAKYKGLGASNSSLGKEGGDREILAKEGVGKASSMGGRGLGAGCQLEVSHRVQSLLGLHSTGPGLRWRKGLVTTDATATGSGEDYLF